MGLKPIDRWANEGPDFNRAVADAVYSTVMKMDADEAVMFTRLVADAALEDDLMVHGELIAKALTEQAAARAEVLKGHLARTAIAKARRGESADQELIALDTISKNFIGDLFSHDKRAARARKQQRGVGTGQFVRQTNDIVHTGIARSDVHAGRQGIPSTPKKDDDKGGKVEQWNPQERAAFQEAYHQVSELIKPYQRLPEGKAFLHLIDDRGEEKVHRIPGEGKQLDAEPFDPTGGRKVVRTRISVLPPDDEQGAVFSAFDAMGMPNVGATMAGSTKNGVLDASRVGDFTDDIRKPTDEHRPSDKVFRRLDASASLLSDTFGNVAPPQAKMAIAVARHVGGYGPAATNLIGPTVDRAAYRYRGTERTVDPRLAMAMEHDGRTANKQAARDGSAAAATRAVRDSEARRDDQLTRNAATFNGHAARIRNDWELAARNRQAGLLSRGDYKKAIRHAQGETKRLQAARVASDTAAHKQHQQTVAAAERVMRDGDTVRSDLHRHVMSHGYEGDDQRWKQSQVIGYMRGRVPTADLAQLHLTAGTVPPSEGVILDKDGNVSSQAVGYGDDHYLPFTLKGMRKMRGGSYIRTRTWGGPTAEDIRTSLIGGAKSLTVVSNNGVFNVDFADDFTGGRRHNDKAHRMIGRYEHLLDAVRHGKVSRGDIDASRRAAIEQEVAERVSPQFNNKAYRDEVASRIADERKNPVLSVDQRDAVANQFVHGLATEHGHGNIDALLDDLATRRARPGFKEAQAAHAARVREYERDRDALAAQTDRWNKEHPGSPLPAPTPPRPVPSLEVLKQPELNKLRSASPQALADQMAVEFGRKKELNDAYKTAQQTYRENVRELALNGTGYKAAMDALKEQFPYYIKAVSFEQFHDRPQGVDTGYVRPGATRPGAARAGMFDALTSAGKVHADTIRGQGAGLPARLAQVRNANNDAPAEVEPAAVSSAPGAPAAARSEVDPQELQKQVNFDMLDALLKQTTFPKGAYLTYNGETIDLKQANMRDEAGAKAFPAALKPIYGYNEAGEPIEDDDLLDELEKDPRAMTEKLRAAVRWLDTHGGHWEDPEYAKALRAFKSGGKQEAASDTTDTRAVLERPTREYSWAHRQGDAYVPNNPRTADEIANAYRRDGLIGRHVAGADLPANVYEPSFTAKAQALTEKLRQQDSDLRKWVQRGSRGAPPVDPAVHDQQVRGLVHAYTLHTRHGEAEDADRARSAARAEEFRHEEAVAASMAPRHETRMSFDDTWTEEQRRRLEDPDDPLAEQIATEMERKGRHDQAAIFRDNVETRRTRRAQPFEIEQPVHDPVTDPRLAAADADELERARIAREKLARKT